MRPFTTAPVQLRPMDMGDILDASFKVFRSAWKPMLLISLINAVPITVFSVAFNAYVALDSQNPTDSGIFRAIAAAETGNYAELGAVAAAYLGYILLYMLLIPLVNGALMTVIWDVVLGAVPTAGGALRRTAPRYLALVGTSLLKGLGALLLLPILAIAGLVILSIPALIAGEIAFFTYLAFSPQAVVLERVPGGAPAMTRSYRLVKGRFWPLLGLGIVFSIMTSVLSYLITMIATIPMTIVGVAGGSMTPFLYLTSIASGISQMIVVPLYLTGLTLAYFDTRVRKEGLDLELIALAQRQAATQPS